MLSGKSDLVSGSYRKLVSAAIGALIVLGLSVTAAHAQSGFGLVGPMTIPRLVVNGPSAVAALPNGGAFIAGAAGSSVGELYNPSTQTFSAVNMGEPYQIAVLLGNGEVLLACGGIDNSSGARPAAIYDPQTGATARTGDMPTAISACTGTLLNNGEVLIAGGIDANGAPSNAAAIYDPTTGAFSATGALNQGRYGHTATLLQNGTVLIAGGTQYDAGYGPSLNSAELYDPSTGQFAVTGAMANPRAYAAAAPLPNGEILISGGEATFNDNPAQPVRFWNTAEIYDPSSGTFSGAGAMTTARTRHFAQSLANGQILIAGGLTSPASANATASAEIYDSATGSFSAIAPMQASRSFMAAASLTDGQVLVAGGLDSSSILSSAEIYTPAVSTARVNSLNPAKRAAASSPSPLRPVSMVFTRRLGGHAW